MPSTFDRFRLGWRRQDGVLAGRADLDATEQDMANAFGEDESGCPCDPGYYRGKIPAVIPMLAYDFIGGTREQPQEDKSDQIDIVYLTDKRDYIWHQVQRYNGIDNCSDEECLVSGGNSTIFEKARKQFEKVRNKHDSASQDTTRLFTLEIYRHMSSPPAFSMQHSGHTIIRPSEETLIK